MTNATACLRTNNLTSCNSATKAPLKQRLSQWRALICHWQVNWRTRRQLAQLDSYQLKDIGVSHGNAMEEASKPFWKG
ncbi:MAG: DUF1127 domain-containing protein [Motiliproteus sp.]